MRRSRRPRRASLYRNEKEIGHERGPNGYRLCRWCRQEVQPPRITFCSDACVHEWKLRSSTKYLRQHVYIRDCGICARCNVDTRQLRIRLEDKRAELMKVHGRTIWESCQDWMAFLKECRLTVKEAWKSLWQADHITPVADGGGLCGLEGFRTLCIPCHKAVTREWRRAGKIQHAKTPRTVPD